MKGGKKRKEKRWKRLPVTHVPDGEEDERSAQDQRQHVAESRESEGHAGDRRPSPSARGRSSLEDRTPYLRRSGEGVGG